MGEAAGRNRRQTPGASAFRTRARPESPASSVKSAHANRFTPDRVSRNRRVTRHGIFAMLLTVFAANAGIFTLVADAALLDQEAPPTVASAEAPREPSRFLPPRAVGWWGRGEEALGRRGVNGCGRVWLDAWRPAILAPLPGCGVKIMTVVRWCRCALPPATRCHPSGMIAGGLRCGSAVRCHRPSPPSPTIIVHRVPVGARPSASCGDSGMP